MAANKVSIKFDIDNKDLEIVSGKVLTLQQQIKILKQEIQKPGYSPAELDVLKKKLGDVQDQFNATKAKSGDLLTSLQLIPGPIGEIASKVNGAISLLKQFGSFKIEDLKFQIKETIDDFKDVVSGIGRATGITKIYTALNNGLASSFVKIGVGEAAATAGARAFSAALVATGVGALVVALGLAVSALMDFASGSDEAERQQKELNDQIERTNMLLDMDLAAAKRRQTERLAELRKNGATEKQIRTQGIEDLKENLVLTQNALQENYAAERKALREGTGGLETIYKQQQALEEKQRQLISDIKVAGINDITETNKEAKAQREEDARDAAANAQKIKQAEEQRLAQQKAAAAERKRLAEELKQQQKEERDAEERRVNERKEFGNKIRDLYVSLIQDEGERRRQEIKNAEKDELEALAKDKNFIELSEEEKGRIRYAIREKYKNQLQELKKDEAKKEQQEEEKDLEMRLRILEMQGSVLLQGTRAYYNNRRQIIDEIERVELEKLDQKYKDGLIKEEEYEAKKTQITEQATLSRAQIRQQEIESLGKVVQEYLRAFGDIASAIAAGYDEEAKTSKAAFEKRKKFQIAAAIANAAAGIVGVLTAKPLDGVPWVVDAVLKGLRVIALGIQTKNQIDKIKAVQFEGGGEGPQPQGYKVTANRAQGGIISGPGTSTSDSIPAMLSNGEYVVNARATSAFLPMLSAINDYGRRPRFAMGGLVQPRDPASTLTDNLDRVLSTNMDRPVKTYVVSQDMTTQQQFDRQIKSRSLM